jgi:TusA-related sulfurtransferase
MGTDEMLDLTDVEWPVSLLRFNETLKRWPSDSTLDVCIRDPRVVDSVKMIVHNSNHRITRIDQANDCFRICIRKNGHLRSMSGGGGSGNE